MTDRKLSIDELSKLIEETKTSMAVSEKVTQTLLLQILMELRGLAAAKQEPSGTLLPDESQSQA